MLDDKSPRGLLENLKNLRKHGVTIQDIAGSASLSGSLISRWLRGEGEPSRPHTIVKLTRAIKNLQDKHGIGMPTEALPWQAYPVSPMIAELDRLDAPSWKDPFFLDPYPVQKGHHVEERLLEDLKQRILSETSQNPLLCVAGQAGSGKSLLLWETFVHNREGFSLKFYWRFASKRYDFRAFLNCLLLYISPFSPETIQQSSAIDKIEAIFRVMTRCEYLFVLDEIDPLFEVDENGSKEVPRFSFQEPFAIEFFRRAACLEMRGKTLIAGRGIPGELETLEGVEVITIPRAGEGEAKESVRQQRPKEKG